MRMYLTPSATISASSDSMPSTFSGAAATTAATQTAAEVAQAAAQARILPLRQFVDADEERLADRNLGLVAHSEGSGRNLYLFLGLAYIFSQEKNLLI